MKILALLFYWFEEVEAISPIALLRRAGVEVTCVSNRTDVIGAHYIHLTDISLINEIEYQEYDALLIPGGPHYRFIENFGYALNIIEYFMKEERIVCAICAAPTILGKLNLLINRKYTCFTCMNEDFGGSFIDESIVIDGNLITARSAAASIDFAYAIIEKLLGSTALACLQKRKKKKK